MIIGQLFDEIPVALHAGLFQHLHQDFRRRHGCAGGPLPGFGPGEGGLLARTMLTASMPLSASKIRQISFFT
jgi:hypothetical protein